MLAESVSVLDMFIYCPRRHETSQSISHLGFVMVRKILEVKEVTRIAAEQMLTNALQKSGDTPPPPELE